LIASLSFVLKLRAVRAKFGLNARILKHQQVLFQPFGIYLEGGKGFQYLNLVTGLLAGQALCVQKNEFPCNFSDGEGWR
jgi:hypothetical protein